jgi:pimeloyl-ACP methyl ester carboxylesterase
MPSPLDIVLHTPLWVWPLLALVLWLGWSARLARTVHPLRLAALPLVGLGMTAAGILQSAMPRVTLAGWLVGLLLTLPAGFAVGRRRDVRHEPGGRVWVDGGWFALGFAISIFVARYALGVTFGIWPQLARQPEWILGAGIVGGVIAGVGLGWLAGLLLRNRRAAGRAFGAMALVTLLACVLPAGVIAFSSPRPVPRLLAGDSIPGIERWNWASLPAVQSVRARDGAPLTYRVYAGRPDRAVVLVHGSSGAGNSMHRLALELQAAGATVHAISLRGHGGSGTVNGDTSYRTQLDDDLADFVKAAGLDRPGVHRTLIGFSSGGGFVLRQASGSNRALFDAYLAVSPYIGQGSPTSSETSGGWASVAVPRTIALAVLDGFGLPVFQGLPVIRFATDSGPSDTRTPAYSYRLLAGLHLDRDWRGEIARIDRPTAVLVGENDELFRAAAFAPLFREVNPRIEVTVVPQAGHMSMIADDAGVAAVTSRWRLLAGL